MGLLRCVIALFLGFPGLFMMGFADDVGIGRLRVFYAPLATPTSLSVRFESLRDQILPMLVRLPCSCYD